MRPPSRRRLLRGMLGGSLVTLGLPWLERFAKADSGTCKDGFPRRFVLWFWGNGTRPDQWTPSGEGTDWALSEELAGLEPFQAKITVCSGFAIKVDNISPHWSGAAGMLTGQPLRGNDAYWTFAAPTLDQVVAQAIGQDSFYQSLQVGIATDNILSYSAPDAQNFGETDPYTLYTRLFGDGFVPSGQERTADPSLVWRKSVLDAVMEDVATLQGQLGSADKERLERHLEGISALESQIQKLQEDPPDFEACVAPDAPDTAYPEIDGCPQIQAIHDAMSQLIAMSLACDQTRVVMVQIVRPQTNTMFPDMREGHHALTHDEPGDQPQVNQITTTLMDCLGDLLGRLDAIPEGDGTLLDHTVVMACSEGGEQRIHSLKEVPIVLAGGGGGALAMGQHIRSYTEENVGKVVMSVLGALQTGETSWGIDDGQVTEGLSELEP